MCIRDTQGPGAHGLDLCSGQSSSCLPPTACSLPAQVAGPAPGPTLHCNSCLACLASLAFPMPANSLPTPPPHAAGWAPGTGDPAPLGLETVLGSVRHILSSSCPQQAGKPGGVPPALPTTTATAPRSHRPLSARKRKRDIAMAALALKGQEEGPSELSSGQGVGGVPRGQ